MSTRSTSDERTARLPGDDLVAGPVVAMDRVTTLPAPPERVWPWLAQLGKGRGGWYFPARVERVLPRSGLRRLDPALTGVTVGDRVADWGPGRPEFRAEVVQPPYTLVWWSLRDRRRRWGWPDVEPARGAAPPPGVLALSWALVLRPAGDGATRLHVRARIRRGRLGPLVATVGDAVDALTVGLLFAGLRERLAAE